MSSSVSVINATNGKEFVWRTLRVTKSLDQVCHTLQLEVAPNQLPNVHKHDKIQVLYKNENIKPSGKRLVTTVLVDDLGADADKESHTVLINGRSPARDIIDSSWSENFVDMTLRTLVRKIGSRFGGIDCVTFPTNKPDPSRIVKAFRLENESPWTKLTGEADNQGYIFTSNEAGGLYLWPVQNTIRHEGFHLSEGENIKDVRNKENGAEQFRTYIVNGGGNTARIEDTTCNSKRIMTINLTDTFIDATKLRRRAETERNRRRENHTTVSVSSWGLSDEQIKALGQNTNGHEIFWNPNFLIPVKIPSLPIDATLLVSEVVYLASATSMGCDLTLVKRDAYL